MKKKIGMTFGALAGAAVIGWFGMQQTDAAPENPKLSTDDIEQMVTNQYGGTITELELDKKRDQTVYEVEVESEGIDYDLIMDADTGEIIREHQDDIDHNFAQQQESNKGTVKEHGNSENDPNQNQFELISIERAKEIAINEFEGKITELELDEDDGRFIYEMEIQNEYKEAEMEIDAHTEEILEMEIDD